MKSVKLSLQNKILDSLPASPGVYIFISDKKTIYVGKSINIKARVKSHFANARLDAKEKAIVNSSNRLNYMVFDSEFTALLKESYLIRTLQPKYNSRWRDDKSYIYLRITSSENYPRVFLSRRPTQSGDLFYGPFSSTRLIQQVLLEIRKIVPFCTQKNSARSACFYSKIGLCDPCPSQIEQIKDPVQKAGQVKLYRRNIRTLLKIFKGKTGSVSRDLYKSMADFKRKKKFEEAILVRNRLLAYENFLRHKSFHDFDSNLHISSDTSLTNLGKILQDFYPKLKLDRIECYDVSNFSLSHATASLVVAVDGILDRSLYRKFKIKNVNLSSDIAMLEEVLRRRFRNSWPKPDLLLVDGGQPQLRTVLKVLSNLKLKIPALGIAKDPDRLIVEKNFRTLRPQPNDSGFNLIRLIRDESHRFARKYHLLLRSKNESLS